MSRPARFVTFISEGGTLKPKAVEQFVLDIAGGPWQWLYIQEPS